MFFILNFRNFLIQLKPFQSIHLIIVIYLNEETVSFFMGNERGFLFAAQHIKQWAEDGRITGIDNSS